MKSKLEGETAKKILRQTGFGLDSVQYNWFLLRVELGQTPCWE